MARPTSRRSFLKSAGLGAAALGLGSAHVAAAQQIQGFEQQERQDDPAKVWQPVSQRKIRMGIAGFGVCQFGAAFSLQDHPNVEIVAVSDLLPDRCRRWPRPAAAKKPIRHSNRWSRTIALRPSSWRPMRPAMRGIAWKS